MIPIIIGLGVAYALLSSEKKDKGKGQLGKVNISETPIPAYVLRTMPQKIINYIAQNFDAVYGSPYSSSYYSKPGQSWNYTPEEQIRVANHWNFYSRNYNDPDSVLKLHAETNIPVENNTHWTIAKKRKDGVYEVIISLPVVKKIKIKDYKEDLLAQKEPNEILYKFKQKIDQQKKLMPIIKKKPQGLNQYLKVILKKN